MVPIDGLTVMVQVPPFPVNTVVSETNVFWSALCAYRVTLWFPCLGDTVPRSVVVCPNTTTAWAVVSVSTGPVVTKEPSVPLTVPALLLATSRKW